MKIQKNKSKRQLNKGIQILRMFLSYLIIQLHFYNYNLTKNKILIFFKHAAGFYVPTFFVISYYFSYKIFLIKNIIKMKLRLKRILIPYIFWPIIFLIINNLYYIEYKITLKDLYIQLLTGKRIHFVFWFQSSLIFTYICSCIILLLFNINNLFMLQIMGIFGYIYQCLIYYKNLFNDSKFKFKSELFILIFPNIS